MSIRTDWPKHAAASGTHDKVLSLAAEIARGKPGLAACDIPCGAGAFSHALSALGVAVTAVDIAPADKFVFDPARRILHDCNKGLPFPDASLDLVISIEGIEHLENPTQFLRECARVARPGATIILTTPNVDSFRSRKYVFLRGYHKYFGPGRDGEKDSGHMLPVDAMFVTHAASRIGLRLREITTNKIAGKSLVKELLRKKLQSWMPEPLRTESLFYGEVTMYVFSKSD